MNEYWKDGIIGVIVGDTSGYSAQFPGQEEIVECGLMTGMTARPCLESPAGTWSADSSLTLATLDSIRQNGEVIPGDIMLRFVRCLKDGEYTPFGRAIDVGEGTRKAVERFIREPDIQACGGIAESDNGNGSLMRIMPICLLCYDRQKNGLSDAEAISVIDSVSGLTHNHPRAKIACGLYYFIVREIIDNMSEDRSYILGPYEKDNLIRRVKHGLEKGFAFYDASDYYKDEIRHYEAFRDLEVFAWRSGEDVVAGGNVVQTLEAAIWALITSDSYEECVLRTVDLGYAAGKVSAVAGGLAGLYYGIHCMPRHWISGLQRSRWIQGFFCDPEKFILGDEKIQIDEICLRLRKYSYDIAHHAEMDLYESDMYFYDFDVEYLKPGDARRIIDYFEDIYGDATGFRYHARKDREGDKTDVTEFFDSDLKENGLESMNHGDICWKIQDAYLSFHIMCGEKWTLLVDYFNPSYRSANVFKHFYKARYFRHEGLIKKHWTDGSFYVWSEEKREWWPSPSSADDYEHRCAEFTELPIQEIPDDINPVFYQYMNRRIKFDPLLEWYFLWETEKNNWNDGHWVQARCKEAGEMLLRV